MPAQRFRGHEGQIARAISAAALYRSKKIETRMKANILRTPDGF
jgi:hypothetical protein